MCHDQDCLALYAHLLLSLQRFLPHPITFPAVAFLHRFPALRNSPRSWPIPGELGGLSRVYGRTGGLQPLSCNVLTILPIVIAGLSSPSAAFFLFSSFAAFSSSASLFFVS